MEAAFIQSVRKVKSSMDKVALKKIFKDFADAVRSGSPASYESFSFLSAGAHQHTSASAISFRNYLKSAFGYADERGLPINVRSLSCPVCALDCIQC